MIFAEHLATPLLVVHAVLAAAAVGAATHAVLWLRRSLRDGGRQRAVRRFGQLTLLLVALTFAVGLIIYPTYRTRVRAEFLDNAAAIAATRAAAQAARPAPAVAPGPDALDEEVARAARIARWFDVKEYLALVALLASAALALILSAWRPEAAASIGGVTLGLAGLVAALLWATAIIGVVTASVRAV